jgi:hypothetical protein
MVCAGQISPRVVARQENHVMSDWGSSGRRFKSCQPDQRSDPNFAHTERFQYEPHPIAVPKSAFADTQPAKTPIEHGSIRARPGVKGDESRRPHGRRRGTLASTVSRSRTSSVLGDFSSASAHCALSKKRT